MEALARLSAELPDPIKRINMLRNKTMRFMRASESIVTGDGKKNKTRRSQRFTKKGFFFPWCSFVSFVVKFLFHHGQSSAVHFPTIYFFPPVPVTPFPIRGWHRPTWRRLRLAASAGIHSYHPDKV